MQAATTTPEPTAPPASPAAGRIDDFPDRISPIVVKELRQGLRQPTFVIMFLFLQGLLTIVVFAAALGSLNAPDERSTGGSIVSGFLFALFAIAVLVVQPLRGLNALASEIRAGTIDLLLLTRLDAWRITFGKWLALMVQSGLILVALLPFLILRYYLGGMQLFAELLALGTLFVVAAALAGITVGFSATPSMVIRGIVALGLLFGMMTLPQFMMFAMFAGRGVLPFPFAGPDEWRVFFGVIGTLLFTGYYFLELGATQIAPPSENRSTRKRLLGLAVLGLLGWVLAPAPFVMLFCLLAIASFLGIDALTEQAGFTASVTRRFVKAGLAGRAAGRFLYPGWPCGLFFALLLGLVLVALLALRIDTFTGDFREELFLFLPIWLAMLLHPAALVALFHPHANNRFALYLVYQIGTNLVAGVLMILCAAFDAEGLMVLLSPLLPTGAFMGLAENDLDATFIMSCIAAALAFGVLGFRALPHYRRIRDQENRMRGLPPKPQPPAA
jgi:ABC-type transport system involved in multi-copper enzyme maturation permease subunit